MDANSVFAVVDLETTGTSMAGKARIIQVSASFVQHNQIVDSYSTYINDHVAIPTEITELTGISAQTIMAAPSFDQVAAELYQKLQATVFVAHNVNFDFPFLNQAFERAGYPPLTIEAVDTVTLTQILFPTLSSYRLQDLSRHFKIEHRKPHSSASDAAATAALLLILIKRIDQLPLLTLQTLVTIGLVLPKQTMGVFKTVLQKRRQIDRQKLGNQWLNLDGIIIRKPRQQQQALRKPQTKFPLAKKQKERWLTPKYQYRESQAAMMNLIYRNYADSNKTATNLLLEAPTGSGKTLGYLLPMAYLAQKNRPVVISTPTILLQQQLQQVSESLSQTFKLKVNVALVKGRQHYLDLNRFADQLFLDESNQLTQFIKAQLLVWLTETMTGDLDELNFNQTAPFLAQINYQTTPTAQQQSEEPYDFLTRQQQVLARADVIITNHSYLCLHAARLTKVLQTKPYLVIDEAQQLPDAFLQTRRVTLSLGTVKKQESKIKHLVETSHGANLMGLLANDPDLEQTLSKCLQITNQLGISYQELLTLFAKQFQTKKDTGTLAQAVNLQYFKVQHQTAWQSIMRATRHLKQELDVFNHKIQNRATRWLPADYQLFLQFNQEVSNLIDFLNQVTQVVKRSSVAMQAFWLSYRPNASATQLRLVTTEFAHDQELQDDIYQYFEPAVFTGSVLFSSKKAPFIYRQLGLERSNTRMKRFQTTFNLKKQLNIMVAQKMPLPANENNPEYVAYLANSIQKIYQTAPTPTLVLFNSQALLAAVYQKLNKRIPAQILASNISGSREKIMRRFSSNQHSIILGSSSFWEGVDFPHNYLKSVIIPRIPFAAPQNPLMQAHAAQLKAIHKQPFVSYSLPQAILTLKQGIGRVIRSENDTGIATILDDRILTKKYGKQISSALDELGSVSVGTIGEIIAAQRYFLAHS